MTKVGKKVRNKRKILRNRPSYGLFRYIWLYNHYYLRMYSYSKNGKPILKYEAYYNMYRRTQRKRKWMLNRGDIIAL